MNMQNNDWDFIFLLAIVFIAIATSILQQKIRRTNWKEQILNLANQNIIPIAILLIGFLVFFYRSSSLIDHSTLGNAEKFGQLGDFIGGIINPIFGFITVLILLNTLRLQRNELEDLKNLDTKKALEELITSNKEQLHKLASNALFWNTSTLNTFSLSSTILHNPDSESNFALYNKLLQEIATFDPSEHKNPWITHSNLMQLLDIQDLAIEIYEIYEDLIDLNHATKIKIWHFRQARRFLDGLIHSRILLKDNAQNKLDCLSSKIPNLPTNLKSFSRFSRR